MARGPVGFDLDMTLIDARPAIMAAWSALARETATEVDLAAVDSRLGIKLEDELGYWFPAEDLVPTARIYRRHYVDLAPRLTTALPGAHEALAAVRQAGESAVIITAKHPVSVDPCLAATGLRADEVFSHVHGPEKAPVLRRIRAAVYVGDTPPDVIATSGTGAVAVGVATGSFTRQELLEAGASVVLDSLRDFPSWYARSRNET
jgi:phosphoglycolate phosphatase